MADNLPITGSTAKVATKDIGGDTHVGLQTLVDQLGVDALGALVASPAPLTLLGRLKAAVDALDVIKANTDGVEGPLATIISHVDGIEAALATLITNGDGVEGQLAAVLNVAPQFASGGMLAPIQTAAAGGTNYVAFAAQACKQVTIVNDTGTKLQVRRVGSTNTVTIFDQAAFTFFGLTNANQLELRRKDGGTTQVTVEAVFEG